MDLPSTAEASADTFLIAVLPDTNSGAATAFYCQLLEGFTRKSLIAFDLSAFASDWVASECLMYVRTFSVTNAGLVNLYNMLVSWAELEATWNDRLTATPWDAPGLTADVDYDSTVLDSVNITNAPAWFTFDITALFNSWLSGSVSNLGILLQCPDLPTYVVFYSRNHSTPSNRPYLSITWAEI
jgi:hypothetical protein